MAAPRGPALTSRGSDVSGWEDQGEEEHAALCRARRVRAQQENEPRGQLGQERRTRRPRGGAGESGGGGGPGAKLRLALERAERHGASGGGRGLPQRPASREPTVREPLPLARPFLPPRSRHGSRRERRANKCEPELGKVAAKPACLSPPEVSPGRPESFNALDMFSAGCTRGTRRSTALVGGEAPPLEGERSELAVRLTQLDQDFAQQGEESWQEHLRAKSKHLQASRSLSDLRELRLVRTAAKRAAGECQEVEGGARDDDEEHEDDDAKPRWQYGVYGPVKVWIERLKPEAPVLEPKASVLTELEDMRSTPNASRENRRKTLIKERSRASSFMHAGSNGAAIENDAEEPGKAVAAAEDAHDAEALQAVLDKIDGWEPPEGKYAEDRDFQSFFLEPPAQLTHKRARSRRPPMRVDPEELPDPRRARRRGKGAVCVAFRATGFQLEGKKRDSLARLDKAGLIAALMQYLHWVRFLVVRYEDGLEMRSHRPLQADDFDLYLTKPVGPTARAATRTRVAVLVWVNLKDVERAANTLAAAADSSHFRDTLVHCCPTLAQLNGVSPLVAKPVETARPDEGGNSETKYTAAELDKYSVMSPAASAALWSITVRIDAGLEIHQELLTQARADLEARFREFECTNRRFESDRVWTQRSYHGAKATIGAWRTTLYRALLESEYG